MALSDDRINELSHRITEALEADGRARFTSSSNTVRLAVRRALGKAMRREAEAAERAENKILNQSRNIPEGSSEWDALYWQFYEEEIGRLRGI